MTLEDGSPAAIEDTNTQESGPKGLDAPGSEEQDSGARDREAFDAAMRGAGFIEDEQSSSEGQAPPSGEEESESEGQATPEDSGEEASREEKAAGNRPDQNTLRRFGFTEKEFEILPADRQAVLAEKLGRMQSDFERLKDDLRTAREQAPGEPGQTETEGQAPPTDEELQAQLDALTEALGEDESKPLVALLKAQQATLAATQAKLQEMERAGVEEKESQALETARQQVVERFPGLSDPAKYAAVQESMKPLASLPKYRRIAESDGADSAVQALMVDAARITELEEAAKDGGGSEESKTEERKTRPKQRPGKPSKAAPKPKSPEDQDRAAFNHLMQNDASDVDGARRAAGL